MLLSAVQRRCRISFPALTSTSASPSARPANAPHRQAYAACGLGALANASFATGSLAALAHAAAVGLGAGVSGVLDAVRGVAAGAVRGACVALVCGYRDHVQQLRLARQHAETGTSAAGHQAGACMHEEQTLDLASTFFLTQKDPQSPLSLALSLKQPTGNPDSSSPWSTTVESTPAQKPDVKNVGGEGAPAAGGRR